MPPVTLKRTRAMKSLSSPFSSAPAPSPKRWKAFASTFRCRLRAGDLEENKKSWVQVSVLVSVLRVQM